MNVQSIISNEKRAMLSAHLERFKPDILVLNETWLDESVASIVFANYSLVSRRDRPNSKAGKLNHGGVAVYSRDCSILVTHIERFGGRRAIMAHYPHRPGWCLVWSVVPSAGKSA